MVTRRRFLARTAAAAAGFPLFSILGARGAERSGLNRPNLLLVFPDQLRPDWNELTPGLAVRTPHLAAFAAQGMRFTRAYCPSPLCAPSRACLAQGRRYGRTGVAANEDNNPDGVRTFYQRLREAGYRVGSVGKLDLRKGAYDWGPDGLHQVGSRSYFRDWGFTDGFDSEGKIDVVLGVQKLRAAGKGRPEQLHPYARMLAERPDGALTTYLDWYRDWRASGARFGNYGFTRPCGLADPAYNDNWVGARAVRMIEHEFAADQPWFLQVNFPGPHNPLDITPPMAEWYRAATFPQPIANHQLPPETHVAIRRNYSAMVDNIDRWFGRILAALEARGMANHTLVVFASDHGEMLGDHDRWGKTLPYESSASVPLMVRGAGIAPGTVHRTPASTLDLSATFLDYAGLPTPADMDSRSLRPLLGGENRAARRHVISALGPWKVTCRGAFKLVQGFDPAIGGGVEAQKHGAVPPLLFDVERDPGEQENLADRQPELVAELARLA